MRKVFKAIFSTAILFAVSAALLPGTSYAQDFLGGLGSGSSGSSNKRKGPQKPVEITSESLDLDMSKNNSTITFTGSVVVDSDDMKIFCHKLTIFLEEKDEGDAGMKKDNAKDKTKDNAKDNAKEASSMLGPEMAGGKEPKLVVCEKDVVIIRKIYDPVEKTKGEQKATGGKAVYDLKTGKIELTENNPTIIKGNEFGTSANVITLWRNSSKATAMGNVKTWMVSSGLESGENKEAAPAKEVVPQETNPVPGASRVTQPTTTTDDQSEDAQQQTSTRKVYNTGREKSEAAESSEKTEPASTVNLRSVIATDDPEQK